MRGVTVILVAAGLMLAVGLLTVLAWFIYSTYLDRVERRLAARKGLYRELVSELATRDRALLEPTIHQMSTLYDLDALEAVLEEQARSATGRPGWLLEVYDQLGLVDKYVEKLRSARKWRDRAFAAELLGRVGSAKAVPALLATIQATQTEDSDVREIALRALARIADPGAVDPLIVALASAEVWLAPRIADILTRHGDLVIEPLLALLDQTARNPARAWAANVLGEVRAQRAFAALVRCLDDPDDEVRAKSATALGRLGDHRAVTPLLERLLTDPAPFVRARIASTLGQFEGPEVIDRLVRALGDPAWWVRMRGVEALEQIGSVAAGPLLVALDDPDPEIRQRAAGSLERLGLPDSLIRMIESGDRAAEAAETLTRLASAGTRELLAELLLQPSPRIREIVIASIHRAGRDDLAAVLTQVASSDPEPALRVLAFDTLRVLRVNQALPEALAGVAGPEPTVRAAAIRFLGELGGRDVIEMVRAHSSDPEPLVRAAAARALGDLRSRDAQADLLRLMGDPDALVREAAVLGAVEAGLHALAPSLVELLEDNDERVRHAAARATAALGDHAAVPALLRAFETATPDLQHAITLAVSRLDSTALTGLTDALVEKDDVGSRLAVARTLGRMRWPGGSEHLLRLSGDTDSGVRAAAIHALGRWARSEGPLLQPVKQVITAGMSDPDQTVRASAIDACSRLCLEDQGRVLLSLLQGDPAAQVRERAALAIGLMRLHGGEEALIAACRRAEPAHVRAAAVLGAGAFVRDSLVTLIFEMPDEASVRELLRQRLKRDAWFRLLSRKLPPASIVELRALAAPGSDQGRSALADGMQTILDAGERVRLIGGLRAFQGEPSRAALLQTVRGDPNAEVRTAALTAVAELLDTDELLAFGSRALRDPSIMVRRAAVGVFARVPADRAFRRLIQALRVDDDPAVLASAAGLAEESFPSFREAVLAVPLQDGRAVLVARLSRYIHHPDLPEVLSQLSRSGAAEVREAVAEVWRHRPDASEPVSLNTITADPVVSVRRTAAGAAAAAARYDLLDRMTQDPDAGVRRQVAIALGWTAPVGHAGLLVLDRLEADDEVAVRAAAYVARLLQGLPIPFPPGLDPRAAAEAVRDAGDLATLRNIARIAPAEERRLAAALALALIQDETAREVARTDPAPAIRHRVGGALELAMPNLSGESA
ncbi:MAG TPA: HEAT repeat domain-containing protein [Gemmatimonadales bacterium]